MDLCLRGAEEELYTRFRSFGLPALCEVSGTVGIPGPADTCGFCSIFYTPTSFHSHLQENGQNIRLNAQNEYKHCSLNDFLVWLAAKEHAVLFIYKDIIYL